MSFFGNDSQIGEIFYEDVERKKAFESTNLWWQGMRKRNKNTLNSASDCDDKVRRRGKKVDSVVP